MMILSTFNGISQKSKPKKREMRKRTKKDQTESEFQQTEKRLLFSIKIILLMNISTDVF
jgi:hypothetical protein